MSNQNENPALPDLGFDFGALANKGTNFKKGPKVEYLKEGSAAYRILPPVSSNGSKRLEHAYYLHWISYMDETGKERNQKVQCTKYQEGYCPLCVAHDDIEQQIKHAEANGATEDKLKALREKEAAVRVSGSVYLTAINSSNEIVALQISKTVMGLLEKKIMEAVQQKKFDPTNPKTGVWFEFKKQGKGRDSVTVDFRQTSVVMDGETLYKLDRTPLSDELIGRIPTEAVDIHDPSKLYIQQYSAKELADFLRGVPLPNKWKKNNQATGEAAVNNQGSAAAAPATSAVNNQGAAAAGAPIQAAPVFNANESFPQTVTHTSAPLQTTVQSGGFDAAAEAARLRNLSGGNR